MGFEAIEIVIIILANTFGATLLIIVLANSERDSLYRWFSIMTFCLIAWVNSSYLGYLESSQKMAVIFYKINMVSVALFFLSSYIFYIECFLGLKNKKLRGGITFISVVLSCSVLISNYVDNGVVKRSWGNEANFGFLDQLFYIYAGFMTIMSSYYLILKYFRLPPNEKKKVFFFLVGTFFLIFFNLIFNVLSPLLYNTARYQHFGDYSVIIFLAFTAYAILRHKFLDIKVALAAFLISILGMLLIIDIVVLSDNIQEQVLKIVLFVFFVVISVLLVRSVLNEIRQREQLAELSRQQKDIIDVFGHELKTPFTSIRQEVTYLREIFTGEIKKKLLEGKISKEDAKDLLEGLETLNIATEQGIQETNTMLETARLDKARFKLEYTKFDLVKSVKDTYRIMKKQLDPEVYEVKLNINRKELIIEADEVRIKEAVTALLTNAKKYGINPKTNKSKIEISIFQKDKASYISVKDNGVGIKQSDIKELGKKFKRLEDQTNGGLKRPGGTGLGLFVVKGIMENHGGALLIESEGLGKGSTFTLEIPIVKHK